MEFDSYHDWAVLADYFDITVTEDDVETAKNQLKGKSLYIRDNEDDPDIWSKLTIDELAITPYKFDSDIEDDIKKQKLKHKILQLAIDLPRDTETDEESIEAVRDFVENHAEQSFACSCKFWKKVSEIDDDYTFLTYTAKNITDLWY